MQIYMAIQSFHRTDGRCKFSKKLYNLNTYYHVVVVVIVW